VLEAAIRQHLDPSASNEVIATAVSSIASDNDKRRVLEAMVERGNSALSAMDAIVLAGTISSDSDKAHVLAVIADKYRQDRDVCDAVRRAAEKISSDSDYRRVVSRLAA
jgi:hypothetical protein